MYLIRKTETEEISRIKETVQAFAKSMKMPANTSVHEVFDRWSDFVGEYLASQSDPISIRERIIVVAAANPTIGRELELSGPAIVNLINVFLNMQVVDRLEVKTGPNYARRFRRSG